MAGRDPHEFYERWTAVTRRLRTVASKAFAALEVGSAQAKILRHVGRHSRISQADLARATDTARTLTGRALEPLIERGWVRRKRSEDDRREYIVELTAAGQRARQRIEEARERIIARIAGVLDENDLEAFELISTKILAELEGSSNGSKKR